MTAQTIAQTGIHRPAPPPDASAGDQPLSREQRSRAAAYGLIGALLRRPPDRSMLEQVGGLAGVDPGEGKLALAFSMLGLAARSSEPAAIDDEFHELFIGLGRGELMPYASWYLTGFLMERPLGLLRDDLRGLGIERDPAVKEPEDHMAALCEVMQLLIREGRAFDEQARFFGRHLESWWKEFFADLSAAEAAVFYRNLGRFGGAFLELEQRCFAMQV